MIDLRTHAVTLVAVFVALAVGLLVGAARGGPVLARWQQAAVVRIERQFADQQGALSSARATLALLRAEQAGADAFATAALPWIVQGRLRGRQIAVYADAPALGEQVAATVRRAGAAVQQLPLSAPTAGPAAVVIAGRPGDAAAVAGLLERLRAAGIPAVGAEPAAAAPAADATFGRSGVSFVDDADEAAGQAALVLLLAGSRGHYGQEPTAAGPLPPAPR